MLRLILTLFFLLGIEKSDVFAKIDSEQFDQKSNSITPSKDIEDDVNPEETQDSKNNEIGMTPLLVKAVDPVKEEEKDTLEKHIFVDLVDTPALHNDGAVKRDPRLVIDIPQINLPPEKKSWWSQFMVWVKGFFGSKDNNVNNKEK